MGTNHKTTPNATNEEIRLSLLERENIFFNKNLSSINGDINRLETSIKTLDTKVDSHFLHLDAKIDSNFKTLDAKIDSNFKTLDAKIDSNFKTLDSKIDSRFDRLDNKIDWSLRLTGLSFVTLLGVMAHGFHWI